MGDLIIQQRWISQTKTRLAAEIRRAGTLDNSDANLLAVLYEPQLKGWQGATLNLTGWEIIDWKQDGRQIVIQEWACRIEDF